MITCQKTVQWGGVLHAQCNISKELKIYERLKPGCVNIKCEVNIQVGEMRRQLDKCEALDVSSGVFDLNK